MASSSYSSHHRHSAKSAAAASLSSTSKNDYNHALTPDVLEVELPYHQIDQPDQTNGTFTTSWDAIFSGNSPYSCDYKSGSGVKRAQGFDHYALLYQSYQVISSRVEITCGSDLNDKVPVVLAVIPSLSNSANGFPDTARFNSLDVPALQYILNGKVILINNNWLNNWRFAGSPGTMGTIHHQMSTAKLHGKTHLDIMDNTIAATDKDPVAQWFWHVIVKKVGDFKIDTELMSTVIYKVRFFGRKQDVVPPLP
jgi:hypothetical protein